MVGNELSMQFQADMLGVPVVRPAITETTAQGAAYAAGLAVGYWAGRAELARNWAVDRRWKPEMDGPGAQCALPIVAKSGYAVFRLDRESGLS